ncbi:MAG TPA: HEAT repeat domain-containing protein [Gemmataceae bacterium]|nr:HEAT repeat domain-containing protein [Gemmataceae bacterium]
MSRRVIPAFMVLASVAGPLAAQPAAGTPPAAGTTQADARSETDVVKRLTPLLPSVRSALIGNNTEAQRAALSVIESVPPGTVFGADLLPALRTFLSKDVADPDLLALGLRALGKSLPEDRDLTQIVAKHVSSPNATVRKGAADALGFAIQNAAAGVRDDSVGNMGAILTVSKSQLQTVLTDGDSAARKAVLDGIRTAARRLTTYYVATPSGPGPLAGIRNAATDLAALVPRLAAPDWEDYETQSTLGRLLANLGEFRKWAATGRMIESGVATLTDLVGAFPGPLGDPDPATRALASKTVSALGELRRIVRLTGQRPVVPLDPAGDRIRGLVAGLADDLKHPDPAVRLAAASALETMADLPTAANALLRAATDPVVPIRWTVARALRPQIIEPRPPTALELQTLAGLAADRDLDVRTAALVSLEKHGAAGAAATAAALRAAREGDVEPRMAAIKTLAALNSDAASTVPVLIEGLQQEDLRLRRAAAAALARFKTDARAALPELRRALQNPDPELRLGAAEAVLAIEPQPKLSEER